MKYLILLLGVLFIQPIYAQNATPTDIQNKVWKTQEVYVDSILVEQTEYWLFASDGQILVSEESSDLYGYISDKKSTTSGRLVQDSDPYTLSFSNNTYHIESTDEFDFEIVYSDAHNLVMVTYVTVSGESLISGDDYTYPIEFRFVEP